MKINKRLVISKGECIMSTIKITKTNFKAEVLDSNQLVLLDFWASWCGPCKMMSPILDDVAAEVNDQVRIGKVNVDEEQELAQQFKILSIPTLLFIKNGKIVKSEIGVRPKNQILSILKELADKEKNMKQADSAVDILQDNDAAECAG